MNTHPTNPHVLTLPSGAIRSLSYVGSYPIGYVCPVGVVCAACLTDGDVPIASVTAHGECSDDGECSECGGPFGPLPAEYPGERDDYFSDVRWAREHWEALQEPCDSPDCTDGDCDCHSSETIMLSIGYADVWQDGEVVSHGVVVLNVSDD